MIKAILKDGNLYRICQECNGRGYLRVSSDHGCFDDTESVDCCYCGGKKMFFLRKATKKEIRLEKAKQISSLIEKRKTLNKDINILRKDL